MAQHWNTYVDITLKQAMALDKMAEGHGIRDGMSLLMKLTGDSRSKIGKMSYASLRPYIDKAFEEYGK